MPREIALAASFYLVVTVLAMWPAPLRLSDGCPDLWDAKLNAWILHWDFHQIFRDPLLLFDANIFYPGRLALAFSENLFGAAVFGFPMYAAGASTLAAYNVLFLLGMFLSALAAWALAREVTGDAAASLLAGLVYAFLPWRMDQIPHIQFQWGAFLPLLLLYLLRYLDGGRRRDLLFFGGCFAWNALANVHYAIFSTVLVGVALVFELLSGPAGSRGRVLRAMLAVGAASAAVSPFLFPYAQARRLYGLERQYEEMAFYSGRLMSFLSAGPRNRLYGGVTGRFSGPEASFFPGAVPFVLSGLAAAVLFHRRVPRAESTPTSASDGARRPAVRTAIRALDAVFASLVALCAVAAAIPGLRVGVVRLGDPGRLVVFASAVLFARLCLAFPRRSRFRDLGDCLKSFSGSRRGVLFVAIAAAGILIALGANTPYYRFLFKSLGFLFRAIRAPARGIVLFHVALAVLAAWGLSVLAGRRPGARRAAVLAVAMGLTGVEYRAFPIDVLPVAAEPPPVYRWLAGVYVPGGVMEWPLGDVYDFEYEFRSTAHWKPLVNGSSGFAPPRYRELRDLLGRTPISDEVWARAAGLGAGLLIFHPHDAAREVLLSYTRAVRHGVADGRLEILTSFPHGIDRDFVFRVASAPPFHAGVTPQARLEAAEEFARLSMRPGLDPLPPLVALDYPPANHEIGAGEWAYGWALDDSGVVEVRIATELGPVGTAIYGGLRADVGKLYPGDPDSSHCGFGLQVPNMPPGSHTLIVTVFARDGGKTVLRRPIRVR